jgi:C-terminal processing protease CtpA/Prc
MLSFDGHRFVGRVFMPTHYPRSPELFYGGFEMFMLRDPDQVMVAGIEDSPAARAGVHWGDVVVSVNGIPVTGKTVPELESLFLGQQSKLMNLQVDRLGSARTFEFRLERAEDIARQNGKRFLDGKVVPLWASEKDLRCFQ